MISTKTLLATTALCLASSAAAGQSAGNAPVLAKRRTENGVVLLEHPRDALARAPKLALAPSPVIAGGADADPAYDLTNAHNVVLLSDGRLVTLARVGSRVLVFGPDGHGQRVVGGSGSGPGEFRAPTSIVAVGGDTIAIPDVSNSRLNFVHPDRGIVSSRPLDVTTIRATPNATGALSGGRLVMTAGGIVQNGARGSITRPPTAVAIMNPDGSSRQVAAVPDFQIAMVETHYRGRAGVTHQPVGFSPRAIVTSWDTLIVTAIGEDYRIDLRNADGRIVSTLSVAVSPRRVTGAMRTSAIDAELKRLHQPTGEGLVDANESERLIREAPYADSLPPYSAIFIAPNKTMWVVDAVAPGDASWFATAFRLDGAIIGRLQGPSDAPPVAFGNDRVVLRATDSDGVVSLRIHKIVPATP